MRWRRRKNDQPPAPDPEIADARKALEKADQNLIDAQERNPEIDAVVLKMGRYGEQNDFARKLREAMGGAP